jgi:hypothetical protein
VKVSTEFVIGAGSKNRRTFSGAAILFLTGQLLAV